MKKIFLISSVLVILFLISSCDQQVPSKKFDDWMNETKSRVDLNHPYVTCIEEKTCSGNFKLDIQVNSSADLKLVNKTLKEYGNVTKTYCFSFGMCSVRFETDNLNVVKNFIDDTFVLGIHLETIDSDYKLDEKEIQWCKKDDDCIKVKGDCCGCSSQGGVNVINKNFKEEWDSYLSVSCLGVMCAQMVSYSEECIAKQIKCVNNSCQVLLGEKDICDSGLFKGCAELIFYKWGDGDKNRVTLETINMSCTELVQLCNWDGSDPYG